MLPLRRVPPSDGATSTLIVNLSSVPGCPLSVTSTRKVHGAPLTVQMPVTVALFPVITIEVIISLCVRAPLAWFTYCRRPLSVPSVCCCTIRWKFPIPPLTSMVRSEEHTSELQSRPHHVCRLLLEKKIYRSLPYHPVKDF